MVHFLHCSRSVCAPFFRFLFSLILPVIIELQSPIPSVSQMGAENEKQSRPEEAPLHEDEEDVYSFSLEKLLAGTQSKGKKPVGAVSSLKSISSSKAADNADSASELKQTRGISQLSAHQTKINFPDCCVGYLEAEEQGSVVVTGSAFLIHRQLALTCAHNCMKPGSLKQYPNLFLCLKSEGETTRVKVKKANFLDGLFEGENLIKTENYLDFAVLELEKNLEERHGYLGVVFDCGEINQNTVVTAMGYSQRLEANAYETKISAMGPKIFSFPGKMSEKMFGGPLIVQLAGQLYAFGICLWSDPTSPENCTKAFKLYRYLFEYLNANFSKSTGFLNLKCKWVSDGKMEKVVKEKYQLITDLDLEGNRIGLTGIDHLARAGWTELRVINLNSNNIEDQGLNALCSGNWPKLKELLIANTAITTEGMQAFKKCCWTELTHLSVAQNRIKNRGVELIAEAPFKKLTKLNLYQTWINWQAVKTIVEANYDLETLDIGANRIREEGVYWLSKGQWKDLYKLGLSEATVTDTAVEYLTEAAWANLRILDLSRNHLTQAGFESLLKCNFKKMKDLNLRENKIALKGVSAMVNAGWTQLQQVDIRWNSLTDKDKQSVKDLLGKSFQGMRKMFM